MIHLPEFSTIHLLPSQFSFPFLCLRPPSALSASSGPVCQGAGCCQGVMALWSPHLLTQIQVNRSAKPKSLNSRKSCTSHFLLTSACLHTRTHTLTWKMQARLCSPTHEAETRAYVAQTKLSVHFKINLPALFKEPSTSLI